MDIIRFMVYGAIVVMGAFGLFAWLAHPFQEEESLEPERSCHAVLLSREIRRGANRTGRSRVGFNHVLVFQTDDGQTLELYAYEEEYGALREGMAGKLTWKGRYFVDLAE